MEFLEKSQTKDHEFFERLAKREVERELKSQKLMFDAVRGIARISKRTLKDEILYIMYRDICFYCCYQH